MITENQTAVIDFLASPSAHGGAGVERIDAHASIVFLVGARAYKLKRAVLRLSRLLDVRAAPSAL